MRRQIGACGTVACLLFLPLPAVAQQDAQAEDEKLPQFTDEITVRVTARKREENLQSVPFSVAAPTPQVLRTRGAESLEDVSVNVAGFSVQNLGPGQSQIAMRGVSAGQIVRDQPGVKEQVGVYLDESVISLSLFTPDLDLFDMSRIEVLRGPQGTLFGSGSLSGTVRYITNQPAIGVTEAAGEFGVSAIHSGGFGNDAKFAVNIPLGEAMAARITAYNTTIGGFMDAVQPDRSIHENVNRGRRTGARVALRLQPTDQFSITPRLHYQDVSMDGWNRSDAYNILANPYTTTRPAITLGARQHFTQVEEPFADTFLLGDVTVAYDVGGVAVTSITSLTTRDVQVVRDATALGASISFSPFGAPEAGYTLDVPLIDETAATGLTQELRVAGDTERVAWLLGAFYSTAERRYGQSARAEDFVAVNSGAVSDFLRVVTGSPDLVWAGSRTLAGHPDTEELFFSDLTYDFNQLALFGEVSLAVTDRFSLTGGLRWYDFDERRTQTFDGLFADPLDSEGTTMAAGIAPRVIASYAMTEATQVNAQVSKGFRLGGINDPLNTPLCTPRDLETFGDRPHLGQRNALELRDGHQVHHPGRPRDGERLRLLHGHPQPAGDGDGRLVLVAGHLQRAGRPERRPGSGGHGTADAPLRRRPRRQRGRRQTPVDLGGIRRRRERHGHHCGHRGRQAAADDAAVSDDDGRHVAVGDGRLGRLSERRVPARRIALHPDRRLGRGVRLRRLDGADPRVAPGHGHRGSADAEYVHFQSETAGLQHSQHPDRSAQRRVGHRLPHQQRHRRAGVPRARPGAGHARQGRLSDQPAAARRHGVVA